MIELSKQGFNATEKKCKSFYSESEISDLIEGKKQKPFLVNLYSLNNDLNVPSCDNSL